DGVVVDFDLAIFKEQAKTVPTRQRIADRIGELGLLADQRQFLAQPGLEGFDQRTSALLAGGAALFSGAATDVVLDPVKRGDTGQRLGGNRRRATLGQLVKVTANMAPAEGETHLARSGQHLISSIPVYLQHAAEAG